MTYNYEDQGTAYDPHAVGHERVGMKNAPPSIDSLVRIFAGTKSANYFLADQCHGKCYDISKQFREFLEARNIKSSILMTLDYLGEPFANIHPSWDKCDFLCHSVVAVGDMTYDFTAKQFDPEAPVPLIMSREDLNKLWGTVDG